MSQEYYSIEKKNNLGNQFIGTAVFDSIAINVINDIEGVDFVGGAMNLIPGAKGPLTIKVNDNNQVIIHLDIVVDYGLNVGVTVNTIQSNIVNAIEEMIGFRNVKINVDVKGIKF